jgi:hypothetical protein
MPKSTLKKKQHSIANHRCGEMVMAETVQVTSKVSMQSIQTYCPRPNMINCLVSSHVNGQSLATCQMPITSRRGDRMNSLIRSIQYPKYLVLRVVL